MKIMFSTYDFDGNLTKDGLWTYTWDAENRLVSMAMDGNAGYATRIKLDFLYDSENRRVSKAVSTTTSQVVSPTWTLQSTTRFLYDGWNMIAQYSFAANLFTVHAQYVWGLDVNGSSAIASATAGAMQSAGGVGGLLQAKVIDTVTSTTTQCLPCYDGNGNIMAWVDGANSALIERREYDSFGSMVSIYRLATNATLHGRLAYGFSTKWRDAESDLLYYGHRYYNPSTQRWLNRDLIEEAGGINLYGFVGNDGVNQWDLLGMIVNVKRNEGSGTRLAEDEFGFTKNIKSYLDQNYAKDPIITIDLFNGSGKAHTKSDILNFTKKLAENKDYEKIIIIIKAHGQIVGENYRGDAIVSSDERVKKGHYIAMDSNVLTIPLNSTLILTDKKRIVTEIYSCFNVPCFRHKKNPNYIIPTPGRGARPDYLDYSETYYKEVSSADMTRFHQLFNNFIEKRGTCKYAVVTFLGRMRGAAPATEGYQ